MTASHVRILLLSKLLVIVIPLKSGIQSKRQRRLTPVAAFWIPLSSAELKVAVKAMTT